MCLLVEQSAGVFVPLVLMMAQSNVLKMSQVLLGTA
jgi:hypothetical protein